MRAIETYADKGWRPMDCPSEIVGDLHNERDELRTLVIEALELTKYTAAAFAYTEAGSGTPEWFEGLREQLEMLQPKLINAVTHNA